MNAQVSATALGAAKMRAAHLLLDNEPMVFRDEFALLFSGVGDGDSLLREMNTTFARVGSKLGPEAAKRMFQSMRAVMLSRSRFTEDALRSAIGRGIRQYVILGAGLDSFAWRHPEVAENFSVIEIDRPESQAWKRERLRKLGIAEPANSTFLAVDLEQQNLLEALREAQLRLQGPIFISWLGVTQYLTRDSVLEKLRQIASMPSGTELAFTYMVSPELQNPEDRRFSAMAAKAAAERGEPWISFFASDELIRKVETCGFRLLECFRPADSNQRYFTGRSDGLRVPDGEHLLLVEVI